MIRKLAALGAACALACVSSAALADSMSPGYPMFVGAGTIESIPTPPSNGFGVALPYGTLGTRLYASPNDTVTFTVEPAATCGVAAPDATVTILGGSGGVISDENTTFQSAQSATHNVVCVTAFSGTPHYRAY